MLETAPHLSKIHIDENNSKEEIESFESCHPKSILEPEPEENSKEECKDVSNSSSQEILDKKLSRKKKRRETTGINLVVKELQTKWKGIFEFDPKRPLTIKGKKKKLTKKYLMDFFSDLQLKMNEHDVKNLDYFDLDLTGYSALIEGGLVSFSESLSTPIFKDLHYLNLNLNDANVSDQEIDELLTQIATHLHQLEHLYLDFNGCYKMQPQTFEKISIELIPKLQNLKSLSLKMNMSKALNKNYASDLLSSIAEHLAKNLQELELDLSGYNLNAELLTQTATILARKLPKLISFTLVLNGSKQQMIDKKQGFPLKLDSGFATPIA